MNPNYLLAISTRPNVICVDKIVKTKATYELTEESYNAHSSKVRYAVEKVEGKGPWGKAVLSLLLASWCPLGWCHRIWLTCLPFPSQHGDLWWDELGEVELSSIVRTVSEESFSGEVGGRNECIFVCILIKLVLSPPPPSLLPAHLFPSLIPPLLSSLPPSFLPPLPLPFLILLSFLCLPPPSLFLPLSLPSPLSFPLPPKPHTYF